jgi:hypothetical protein
VNDDLTFLPEVQARRALGGRPMRLKVLAPFGAWVGCGVLRVLRVRAHPYDDEVEVTVGYESYRSQ